MNANTYMNGTMKSNVIFYIPNLLENSNKNVIEMRLSLVNAQIPQSWYLINSSNDTLYINSIKISVPHGNYNITSFISMWKTTVGSDWNILYSTVTNKLTFQFPSLITFTDGTNSIFSILGFKSGETYASTYNYTSSCSEIISPFPMNFLGIPRVLISIPTFNFNSKTSYDNGSSSIISCIPVNSVNTGLIIYNNFTNYKSIFYNSDISSIVVYITDDDETFIDFNNLDWGITLQIDIVCEVVRDIRNLHDVYSHAVKTQTQ